MTNRVLLTVVGLLYAAAAAGLVHYQGETYRRSLRERRSSLAPAPAGPDLPAGRPVDRVVSTPRPQPDLPGRSPERPADRPAARPPEVARFTPTPPRVEPPPVKAYESPIHFKPLVIAGLETAGAADEMVFGDALNKLILINHPAVAEGSEAARKVLDAAQAVIDLRERQDVEIKVVVLDTDEVNAFSHLGGYIYLTRGLLSLAGTEEEFRFVVGHELAHIDLKHGQELVKTLTQNGTIAKVGTLQAAYHQIAAGYTEAQEFAADDRAIDRMLKLDHTPRECLMYLRKLRRLADDQNFREGRKAPTTPVEATVQNLGNHIRSQPAAHKRVSRLETRLNATPARPGQVGPAR